MNRRSDSGSETDRGGTREAGTRVRYRVVGMDCQDCATDIEAAAREIDGVHDVRVSIASQVMTLRSEHPAAVEQTVASLGYKLDRITEDDAGVDTTEDCDDLPRDLRHVTPGYRRALSIVVMLNLGYGVVEGVAGILGHSQALQADALDFIGDGLITLIGILAIGWSLAWRARSALIQGVFLGLLGFAVLGRTVYQAFVASEPEAEVMGIFGAIALVVNVTAALVLIPHRKGDANARAVWLFSRNDALGNLAVVVAGGLVALTGTRWPDLIVAAVVAGLFLHSSWSIVRDARRDLNEPVASPG